MSKKVSQSKTPKPMTGAEVRQAFVDVNAAQQDAARARNEAEVKRPGIPQLDPGVLRPEMFEYFWNFHFRMRPAGRKHRRRDGNVGRALLRKLLD